MSNALWRSNGPHLSLSRRRLTRAALALALLLAPVSAESGFSSAASGGDVAVDPQHAEEALAQAADQVAVLDERAAGLRSAYPKLDGGLVHPDIEALRQRLAEAERSLPADRDAATRAAEEIQREAAAQVQEIEQYPKAAWQMEGAQIRLASLDRREQTAVAQREVSLARQSLAEARALYDRCAPGYVERLRAAEHALSLAEWKVALADAAATRRRAAVLIPLLLLAIVLLTAGISLHHGRRPIKREALQLLAVWRAALDRKLAVPIDELEQRAARFVGPASGKRKRPYAGETLRLADQIRSDLGSLSILRTSANSVLEEAAALIQARGLGAVDSFFFPGRYRKGMALLKDPLFQETVGELDVRPKRAAEALRVVEDSLVQGPSILKETSGWLLLTAFRQKEIERAGAADGLFRLPALLAETLPAAEAMLARARTLFATDPVGALRGDGARARRIAVDTGQLAGVATGARQGVLPAIESGIAALREASIDTRWIEEERRRLSETANALASRAVATEVGLEIEGLALHLADLGVRVERAVALSRVLGETARPEIGRVAEIVQVARQELGSAVGLPADRILREADADPSERLDRAFRQAGTAQVRLGEEDLDAAAAALAESVRLKGEAEEIVIATRQAFAAQKATVEERRTETDRIERLLPDHERILGGIRETFAPSVLSLRTDDPVHPGANGTLADNLKEARVHVRLAHEKLSRSSTVFAAGQLLAAARLLREVKEHQELAVHRLEEVTEREARLIRAVAGNRDLLTALDGRVQGDRAAVVGDPRVMEPTVAAFLDGVRRFEAGRRMAEAAPGDPLLAEDQLLAAQSILGEVHDRMVPRDLARYAEAQRSVEAASWQLAAAGDLARLTEAADRIPDSPEVVRGRAAVAALATDQAQAEEALRVPHGDWNELDTEADRITEEGARWTATLQGEITAATRFEQQ